MTKDKARACIDDDPDAAHHESLTPHRLLIESWAQAMWETDAAGVVTADSPSWRAYTGQTVEEWLGHGWLNAIHPDDRAYVERQWREAVAARTLVNAEFRLRAPGTGWRWTNVRAIPVLDAGGQIAKWVGVNIDIDARKRAEAALRESEQHRRIALESGGMGAWRWDLASGRVWGDGALLSMWGFPPSTADIRYDSFTDRISAEGAKELAAKIAEAVEAGESFEGDLEVVGGPTKGRWVRWRGRADPLQPTLLQGVSFDITERRAAETALRESEERQVFLLRLSDALRPLADPAAIQGEATRHLLERLDLSRCWYSEFNDPNFTVLEDAFRDGLPSLVGTHDFSDCPEYIAACLAGRVLAVSDIVTAPLFSERVKARYAPLGARAALLYPLVKDGELISVLSAVREEARPWPEWEVGLVGEVAERTWAAVERARAEAARRESEERFQQFANASAAGLWIRDADTLAMEFVSPAVGTIYGVEADAPLNDVKRWAAMIVPEDREAVLGHLEAARAGDTAIHEFRIQRPSDGAFRWIRNTDFPLRDDRGWVQRIGGIAEDVTYARLSIEHTSVLLHELQHRVRNIMGMIRSMANRSEPGALGVEDYRALLEGRLLALARVQALLTREANAGGSLRSIIESEVAAQAHHGGQYALTGPEIQLSPKAVEVLTLAFHELATNALKYGALSVPEGRLSVSWTPIEKRDRPWLSLDWIEEGAPPREPSTRRGFGSELIEARIPYELGGRGKITLGSEGARCHLEFPLNEGESILETDAPQPTTVFGGTLDMTGAPDLTGRTVLVVEDDYYMATDTAKALRGAGAEVLGPCPSEDKVRDLLEDETPTHAVLDLNLGGGGPRFQIAHLLKGRGIPFVFLTGYDPAVIPADMADVVRLQKPLPFRNIVDAVGQL